jgi:(1->4)-alpha-D-glucan 1-alpha-D-glucosylmutase
MSERASLPPRATYRLQLRREFTFADAGRLAPYLATLGVSHVYLSPILAARAGSTHGYDVVDHSRLAPDLGTLADFRAMVATFHRHGLGTIVDIVPNHMGTGPENPRWMDLLRWGRAAENAGFFDIDWNPPQPHLAGKVMLPVLDRPLDDILAAGDIEITHDGAGFAAQWRGQAWPITPPSLPGIAPEDGADVAASYSLGSPARLRRLLASQCWHLADWRLAATETNYRRFFAINDLAAIRVEDPAVFEASHALILQLIEEGAIDGLRIDHIDGLADPKAYLDRLDQAIRARGREPYILVEKILGEGETLPDSWPIAGSTGYDRLAPIDRLFCDGDGADLIIGRYRRATGRKRSPYDLVLAAKRHFLKAEYASEINRLARAAKRLAGAEAILPDRPIEAFEHSLRELITGLPVYRSYVDGRGASAMDLWWLDAAFDAAALDDDDLAAFLRGALTTDLAVLFQQISGPAMAKGMEDTVFYQYVPILALNEVGGGADPGPLGIEGFHALNLAKRRTRPDELIAGSTHDTKRGEDARARLLCLTSIPDDYAAALSRWHQPITAAPPLGNNEQFYLCQTMLGAWPPGLQPGDAAGLADFAARVRPAMRKAVREAEEHTSWTEPDAGYESILRGFIEILLDPRRSAPFLADFAATAERIGFWGALTSLSATLLRLTSPGIPDLYQGSEGWNLSLVDPDNRRAIDFAAAAARLQAPLPALGDLRSSWHDGAVKTALIRAVLDLRRQYPLLFARGDYEALRACGDQADCLVAFMRTGPEGRVIVLAPRFWPRLWPEEAETPRWGDTRIALPPGQYRDPLTGAEISIAPQTECRVAELLGGFPCAVLVTGRDGA